MWVSVVPLAGHHLEVGASLGNQIGNLVVAAVDVGESLVEGYVEFGELVVAADEALEECLVAQVKSGEVVVGAVDKLNLLAVLQ